MEKDRDWVSFLTEGEWATSLNNYTGRRLRDHDAWTYALMTSIAWFITFLVYQRYRYVYPDDIVIKPIWTVSRDWFTILWIVNHWIIGYVVYKVHEKYDDTLSDVFFLLNLVVVVIMFIEEFVGANPRVTIIFQFLTLASTIVWMLYLVRLGAKVGYLLLFYVVWMIYWIAVNYEVIRTNPEL